MVSEKYIGLDVHQATIVVAVMDSTGKLVMESILETKAATILQFFAGLRGTLSVTFEEGTWAAWLYDLLKPHVDKPWRCYDSQRRPVVRLRFRLCRCFAILWLAEVIFDLGPRHQLTRGGVGPFIRSWNYDSFGLAARDRTSIAPRHVTPAPST
jgi:hypothetical protein